MLSSPGSGALTGNHPLALRSPSENTPPGDSARVTEELFSIELYEIPSVSGKIKQEPGEVAPVSGRFERGSDEVTSVSVGIKQEPGEVASVNGRIKQETGEASSVSGRIEQETF
jgi:hypothetical protein